MLQLPLVLLLRAQAQPDEPAPFLFGNLSFPLEVLNASQKELLATSDHRRRLGTCHPAADPKNHKRPECRDYATRSIVLEGLSREDCLCVNVNGENDNNGEFEQDGVTYVCPDKAPRGECRDRATQSIVLREEDGAVSRARCKCEGATYSGGANMPACPENGNRADCITHYSPPTQTNPGNGHGQSFNCRQRFWKVIDLRRYWVEVGDPFLPQYNASRDATSCVNANQPPVSGSGDTAERCHQLKSGICSPGHFFKCSDAPCCWGTCDGTDINRYYRCYRKKVCIDPGCGCKCGPCWNSHVDCDQTADAAHCNPPTLYPRRYAGCCCEDCECEDNYASPRVDGCCTCKHCPPGEASDGRSLQCTLDSSATAAAPTAGLLVVAAVLAVYAV